MLLCPPYFYLDFKIPRDLDEALRIAHTQLATLHGSPEPIPVADMNAWACIYNVQAPDLIAVAFTPLDLTAKLSRTMKAYR